MLSWKASTATLIYEFPDTSSPIRQGDIFRALPRVELSLQDLSVVLEDQQTEVVSWEVLRHNPEPLTAIVGLRSVWAIVITQDCDTIRAPDISLCEVKPFVDVVKLAFEPKNAKEWVEQLKRQAILNLKWFYLPPDPTIGFSERMAVDFLATIRIQRVDLEESRHLRGGRLNVTADEHFRERLAEYFRRYPYNEWYPFNKDEFDAYKAKYPGESITPYPYQS